MALKDEGEKDNHIIFMFIVLTVKHVYKITQHGKKSCSYITATQKPELQNRYSQDNKTPNIMITIGLLIIQYETSR